MIKSFKISLDRSMGAHQSKKFHCPSCGKKRFVRYIYLEGSKYLPSQYGRCDREESCGYWLKPERSFYHDDSYSGFSSFSKTDIDNTLKDYHQNNFVEFLINTFDSAKVMNVIGRYFVGTIGQSTIYWQLDANGFARSGKVINYNSETGKREPGTSWMHTLNNLKGFNLQQCFFGEHLIKASKKKIGIVESEKTALIAAIHIPEFTWIATGSKNGLGGKNTGLKLDKCEPLEDRDIILFPDLSSPVSKEISCFSLWSKMGKELEKELGCSVAVFDGLELIASIADREAQLDLADFILREISKPAVINNLV